MPSICHSAKCQITDKPITEQFDDITVHYCPECSKYAIVLPDCDHLSMQIEFEYPNGQKKVMYGCTKCKRLVGYGTDSDMKVNMDVYVRSMRNDLAKNVKFKEFAMKLFKANKDLEGMVVGDWWEKKRKSVISQENAKCSICGGVSHEAHHITYIQDGKEVLFSMECICPKCYENYNITHIEL